MAHSVHCTGQESFLQKLFLPSLINKTYFSTLKLVFRRVFEMYLLKKIGIGGLRVS